MQPSVQYSDFRHQNLLNGGTANTMCGAPLGKAVQVSGMG